MDTHNTASDQAFKSLKNELDKEHLAIEQKMKDLERKNMEIESKKKDITKLENEAKLIQMEVDRLKHLRVQNEEKLKMLGIELKRLINQNQEK